MGMIGRPSVVHFAGVTQWTYTGKQMNGVRLMQIHPKAAAKAGHQARRRGHRRKPARLRRPARRCSGRASAKTPSSCRTPSARCRRRATSSHLPRYEPANVLIDDRYFDNLSGQQAYKCFACRVRKA